MKFTTPKLTGPAAVRVPVKLFVPAVEVIPPENVKPFEIVRPPVLLKIASGVIVPPLLKVIE